MWPYPTYKPISWDKYYAQSIHQNFPEHNSITSGLAAGITIGIFFTVFLLTFVCRLYSRRNEANSNNNNNSAQSRRRCRRHTSSHHSNLFICGDGFNHHRSSEPPPSYEVAIRMPKPKPIEPPPFSNSEMHPDSYSSPISLLTPTLLTSLNYPPPILAENLHSGAEPMGRRRSASPPPNIFDTKQTTF